MTSKRGLQENTVIDRMHRGGPRNGFEHPAMDVSNRGSDGLPELTLKLN